MTIYILTVIIVICFILGVSFLYQGMAQASRISAEEFEKAKSDLTSAKIREGQLKTELESAKKEAGESKTALQQTRTSHTEVTASHAEVTAKAQQEIVDLKVSQEQLQAQITEFEAELNALYVKADSQAQNALDIIEKLHKENEQSKIQVVKVEPAPDISPIENLKAENQNLQSQLASLQGKIQQFQDLENKTFETKAQEQSAFEEKMNKLKEINNFLTQKEQLLQAELKKNRVRVVGLEKICEDLKIQLDPLAVKSRVG